MTEGLQSLDWGIPAFTFAFSQAPRKSASCYFCLFYWVPGLAVEGWLSEGLLVWITMLEGGVSLGFHLELLGARGFRRGRKTPNN